MEEIASPPGGFRRALLMLSVPALCVACTDARVDYATVPAPSDIAAFRDPGIHFRIPRSLILISAATPQANPAPAQGAHASATAPTFTKEVIDPVSTGNASIRFPHNPQYSYSVALVPDTAGVVSREDFFAKVAVGSQHIFPVPQCVQARITITGPKAVELQATAVPSEFEIPKDPLQAPPALSPLYTMHPRNDVLSTTTLQVAYLADSKIMKSVGSTVTDNTQAFIKSVASVATAVLPFLPFAATKTPSGPEQTTTLTVTAADNNYLQSTAIPASGTVTFATCGANVETKADASPAGIAAGNDLASILTAVNSLYSSSKGK